MAEPSTLTADASCIACGIPKGMEWAVIILLLKEYTGNTMTIPELVAASACYDRCIPDGGKLAVIISLLDTLVDGGGGGGSQYVFSGNYGGGAPSDVPTVSAAVGFDTSTGTEWHWYDGAWH